MKGYKRTKWNNKCAGWKQLVLADSDFLVCSVICPTKSPRNRSHPVPHAGGAKGPTKRWWSALGTHRSRHRHIEGSHRPWSCPRFGNSQAGINYPTPATVLLLNGLQLELYHGPVKYLAPVLAITTNFVTDERWILGWLLRNTALEHWYHRCRRYLSSPTWVQPGPMALYSCKLQAEETWKAIN